jgi:hypothetical protein
MFAVWRKHTGECDRAGFNGLNNFSELESYEQL